MNVEKALSALRENGFDARWFATAAEAADALCAEVKGKTVGIGGTGFPGKTRSTGTGVSPRQRPSGRPSSRRSISSRPTPSARRARWSTSTARATASPRRSMGASA